MSQKVIVVDDEPFIVQQVVDAIKTDGWEVSTAMTGLEAFAKVTSEEPWLLILGETLPDMKGHQLLIDLASKNATLKQPGIIMLRRHFPDGGFGLYSEFKGALEVDMYLTKPFNSVELRSFVNRLFAAKHMETSATLV